VFVGHEEEALEEKITGLQEKYAEAKAKEDAQEKKKAFKSNHKLQGASAALIAALAVYVITGLLECI
jgi:hypothetical protein